jgi:Uma2 family endonuclease
VNALHQPQAVRRVPAQHLVLNGVGWDVYDKLLEALGEQHFRITYDRGDLEVMAPLPPHELYKTQFGRLLDMLAEELDIPVRALGSTTFRRQDRDRGLEPDECFYLSSIPRVRDWDRLDLSRDPPPDLALEIDTTRGRGEVTSPLPDRMGVYAGLSVPEVWRFDGTTLQAYRLTAGPGYEPVPNSPALPFLPLDEVIPYLDLALAARDDREILRAMRAWVRRRVRPLYEAWAGSPPAPPPA